MIWITFLFHFRWYKNSGISLEVKREEGVLSRRTDKRLWELARGGDPTVSVSRFNERFGFGLSQRKSIHASVLLSVRT